MATLTGRVPPDGATRPGSSLSLPSCFTRSTDTWLLPASAATMNLPSAVIWIAPWEAKLDPVPAPPATKGECARGVRLASAWRGEPDRVLVPGVLSLTYTYPVTGEVGAVEALATPAAPVVAKPIPARAAALRPRRLARDSWWRIWDLT